MFEKMFPVKLRKLHYLLQNNHKCLWCQDDISLEENRIFGEFKFGTTGRNKLECPNIIEEKQ